MCRNQDTGDISKIVQVNVCAHCNTMKITHITGAVNPGRAQITIGEMDGGTGRRLRSSWGSRCCAATDSAMQGRVIISLSITSVNIMHNHPTRFPDFKERVEGIMRICTTCFNAYRTKVEIYENIRTNIIVTSLNVTNQDNPNTCDGLHRQHCYIGHRGCQDGERRFAPLPQLQYQEPQHDLKRHFHRGLGPMRGYRGAAAE